jgi:hypothetical protein
LEEQRRRDELKKPFLINLKVTGVGRERGKGERAREARRKSESRGKKCSFIY